MLRELNVKRKCILFSLKSMVYGSTQTRLRYIRRKYVQCVVYIYQSTWRTMFSTQSTILLFQKDTSFNTK